MTVRDHVALLTRLDTRLTSARDQLLKIEARLTELERMNAHARLTALERPAQTRHAREALEQILKIPCACAFLQIRAFENRHVEIDNVAHWMGCHVSIAARGLTTGKDGLP